jgi:hypothetical protein
MTLYLIRPVRCSNGGARQGGQTGECSHPKDSIVTRTFSNNSLHWVRQCQVCGDALGPWIKQGPLAPREMPKWNEELQRQWRDRNQPRLL